MGKRNLKHPLRKRKPRRRRPERPYVTASAEPDDLPGGDAACSGRIDPQVHLASESGQVADEVFPGVDYDRVLTAPPNETTKCLGIITSIGQGRDDLPMADSDWASIVVADDKA
jgi:hypothetical protein